MQLNGRKEHPFIKVGGEDFAQWYQYFVRQLGGLPTTMRLLIAGRMQALNVPEASPELFDPPFRLNPDYRLPHTARLSWERDEKIAERFAQFSADLKAGKYRRDGGESGPAPPGTIFVNFDEAMRRNGKPDVKLSFKRLT